MGIVLDFNAYQAKQKKLCREAPISEGCTTRLYGGTCPGKDSGACVSEKFDPALHNKGLPLFFAAQHP